MLGTKRNASPEEGGRCPAKQPRVDYCGIKTAACSAVDLIDLCSTDADDDPASDASTAVDSPFATQPNAATAAPAATSTAPATGTQAEGPRNGASSASPAARADAVAATLAAQEEYRELIEEFKLPGSSGSGAGGKSSDKADGSGMRLDNEACPPLGGGADGALSSSLAGQQAQPSAACFPVMAAGLPAPAVLAESICQPATQQQQQPGACPLLVPLANAGNGSSGATDVTTAALPPTPLAFAPVVTAPCVAAAASRTAAPGAAAVPTSAVARVDPAPSSSSDGEAGAEEQVAGEGGSTEAQWEVYTANPHEVSEEDAAEAQRKLEAYRARRNEIEQAGTAKPDMVAFKELRNELVPREAKMHGHVPGVAVGDEFLGKGELAILGVHCSIVSGIFASKQQAWAICLSGAYVDDIDGGLNFEYTGMGGRDAKTGRQKEDQTWTKGNRGLLNAFKAGKPIRVCRNISHGAKNVRYVYEGLYRINRAALETGADGFKVCKFTMEGLRGHSRASHRVQLRRMFALRKSVCLAQPGHQVNAQQRSAAAAALKKRKGGAAAVAKGGRQSRAAAARQLLVEDISGGQEARPIPVYNDVDDTPAPQFTYTSKNIMASDAARRLALLGMEHGGHALGSCGLARMGNAGLSREPGAPKHPYLYHTDGPPYPQLRSTQCAGLYECSEACTAPPCTFNRVVQSGIQLPVYVFHTGPGKGWGLACAIDIHPGEYICSYTGEVLTDKEAELHKKGGDDYLFDQSHFWMLEEERMGQLQQQQAAAQQAQQQQQQQAGTSLQAPAAVAEEGEAAGGSQQPLPSPGAAAAVDLDLEWAPRLPPQCRSGKDEEGGCHWDYLVIDAKTTGGVGRFLNHSCQPNVEVQPVLVPGDSGMHYTVAFYCGEHVIKAGTELVYDYGYKEASVEGRRMVCRCGAPNCRGNLL